MAGMREISSPHYSVMTILIFIASFASLLSSLELQQSCNSAATVPLKQAHNLIRKRLILPYLTSPLHPSFIEEYAGGLLMALQKQD
jgi:hypothetical protein